MTTDTRPPEPSTSPDIHTVWYRDWECGFDEMSDRWAGEGWRAYKGGADLDAPTVSAKSWDALLDAIDDEEDET
jgi:hypothetical protein